MCLHYKDQLVNAVLLWELYETHKYSVGKMQSYRLLKQVVLKGLVTCFSYILPCKKLLNLKAVLSNLLSTQHIQ
jgi:hypothetical protein